MPELLTDDRAAEYGRREPANVYVICVNLPGCCKSKPYAVLGEDAAWDCAQNETGDEDCWPYSRGEWYSALKFGGATVPLESGYVIEVSRLDMLGLPEEDREQYEAQARGEE